MWVSGLCSRPLLRAGLHVLWVVENIEGHEAKSWGGEGGRVVSPRELALFS